MSEARMVVLEKSITINKIILHAFKEAMEEKKAEEIEKQLRKLRRKLIMETKEVNGKKKFSLSKKVSVIIVILLALAGIIASIKNSFLVMSNYIEFLKTFAPFFISYITIVGLGRGAKNVAEIKYSNNGTSVEKNPIQEPAEGGK